MKKIGVYLVVFLLLFTSFNLVLASTDDGSDGGTIVGAEDTSTDTTTTSTTTSSSTTTSTSTSVSSYSSGESSTLGNITKAFDCLEEKAGSDCEKANTVTELAFIVLATPDNIMLKCIDKLEKKKKTDNSFGSIKDTALAILALKHAGKDTTLSEKWLVDQKRDPTDLVWFLQQDSEEASKCSFDYNGQRYDINIDENKKIEKDAGTCLKRAQSNFWYQITPSCYSTQFKISCDQDFITNLLYKNRMSSTIYVLEDTQQAPKYDVTEHTINSKCLGASGTCDFEGTAWGAIALQETGHDINDFIPYLISTADLKDSYLPNSFIYLLTSYENYATKLIQEQRFASYWEADNTAYNRYYDTALALLALGTNQEQTIDSKNWLLFEQGTNGCWGNSIRETSFILWVLEQRTYFVEPTTVFCDEGGFYCVPSSMCSSYNILDDTYYCQGISNTCCKEDERETCYDMGGVTCPSNQVCLGYEQAARDTLNCCLAGCGNPEPQTTECEDAYYSCFSDSCPDGKEEADYSCNGGQICCKSIPTPADPEPEGLPWWIWLLVVLIIIVIVAILFVFRDKIKEKFGKKDDDEKQGPGMPLGRPGMPPPRRPGMPPPRGMPPGRFGGGMPPPRRPGPPRPPGR